MSIPLEFATKQDILKQLSKRMNEHFLFIFVNDGGEIEMVGSENMPVQEAIHLMWRSVGKYIQYLERQ
jgi:hypothetical protein